MHSDQQSPRLATLCVHAGTHEDPSTGGVCTPIFPSTAYVYPSPSQENTYPRYFNVPNQRAVSQKIAALEQAEAGLVFGSGMAAITTVLFSCLKPGDHALFQADLYGGTFHFIADELTQFGIELSFARTVAEFEGQIRSKTKIIYIESPSNPLLRVVDIAAIAKLGRAHGVLTAIDNTFASPINQNPIVLGLDVVIHSGTKYLNGHSDVNCGAVVSSGDFIHRLKEYAVNHGGTLDAHACYWLERGLKTLALRVRQQNENAGELARFLQQHPAVVRVNYPGLPDHPDHAVAARQMRGFGGMLSFELREPERAVELLKRFHLVTSALSLGGTESLICVPSRTSHVKMTPEARREAGISEGLMRVSVGIEDIRDLQEDFAQALEGA